MNIWVFWQSEGSGSATTPKTRRLTRSVIALLVPPLPAASRPSNRMMIRSPVSLTQSCSRQSSTCSLSFRKPFASSCRLHERLSRVLHQRSSGRFLVPWRSPRTSPICRSPFHLIAQGNIARPAAAGPTKTEDSIELTSNRLRHRACSHRYSGTDPLQAVHDDLLAAGQARVNHDIRADLGAGLDALDDGLAIVDHEHIDASLVGDERSLRDDEPEAPST